ncbi:unnamed protein product [Arabis nemorensis]|uniref:Uncharacterized protein n=1 Tax=Arabis nemorensis TaxID=586526 RepID=A0A565CPU8_9BRAS|nr:unnamed protein product [Arabis nemorensis]
MDRDVDDGKRAHNNGSNRVRSVVFGLGQRTARMGGRTGRANGLLLHYLLYINHACRLLSFP